MEFREIARARGVLEGLNLPEKIDILDINRPGTRELVFKEGVVWKI